MNTKNKSLLVIFSSILAILFNILFYDKPLGISCFIYTLVNLVFFYFVLRLQKDFNFKKYISNSLAILLLSSIYFRFEFDLFRIINIIIIPLYIIFTISISYKNNCFSKLFTKISTLIFYPFETFFSGFKFLNFILFKNNKRFGILKKIFAGLLICIPLLIIIIILLCHADLVFNFKINYLINKISYSTSFDFIAELIIFMFIFCYLFSFSFNLDKEHKWLQPSTPTTSAKYIDSIILTTILTMINIVYLLFICIQFKYLFFNHYNLPNDFSFAEYARSGFFELVFLTIINLFIIIISTYFSKKEDRLLSIIIKTLLTLISSCTFIMIISSFYRMSLYEKTFGYTRLRLLVYLFIIIETIVILIITFRIWINKFNFIKCSAIVLMVYYICINFVNIDSIVAKQNIDRYFETGKLDYKYIMTLSNDAYLQKLRLLEIKDSTITKYVSAQLSTEKEFDKSTWQSFNISTYKAHHDK